MCLTLATKNIMSTGFDCLKISESVNKPDRPRPMFVEEIRSEIDGNLFPKFQQKRALSRMLVLHS